MFCLLHTAAQGDIPNASGYQEEAEQDSPAVPHMEYAPKKRDAKPYEQSCPGTEGEDAGDFFFVCPFHMGNLL